MFYTQTTTSRSIRPSFALRLMASICVLSLWAGCSSDELLDEAAPKILELSTQELVVGETVTLYGRNFSTNDYQTNKLYFEGVYVNDYGQEEPVSLGFIPIYDGEEMRSGETLQRLRISRLGPFRNPFSASERPGKFVGKITAVVEDDNGDTYADLEPRSFELNVGPSVQITEFQPIYADCGEPALRALQGIAYRMSVKVSGIQATRIVYQFNQVNDLSGLTSYEHSYDTPISEDTVGDVEPIFFNLVPNSEQFYVTAIRVLAYDNEGNVVETALPISVHRPLEVVYDGKREIAQRYEPVPVSGCTPGSVGTRVSYSETKREFRQRTVSVTINQNWVRSQGQNLSRSWREGVSEGQSRSRSLGSRTSEEEVVSESMNLNYNSSASNSVDFSESDGENWRWSVSEGEGSTSYEERMRDIYGSGRYSTTISASAEGSLPFIAKASGKTSSTVGVAAGGKTGNTEGQSTTNSTERGYTTAGSTDERKNFGSATTEGRGQSINNSYALASSTSSSLDEAESVNNNRTWNFSENEVTSEVVSESQSVAEALTVSDSTSEATTQGFGGFIPRGRYGQFYRQTTRWVRRAEVRSYNQCGIAQHIGELQFNEYTWAPDLAIADSCEERPPAPNLPEAACLVQPCGG
jgi:hypothetical protein